MFLLAHLVHADMGQRAGHRTFSYRLKADAKGGRRGVGVSLAKAVVGETWPGVMAWHSVREVAEVVGTRSGGFPRWVDAVVGVTVGRGACLGGSGP